MKELCRHMGGRDESPLLHGSCAKYSPQALSSIFMQDGWQVGWRIEEKPAELKIPSPSEVKPFCC